VEGAFSDQELVQAFVLTGYDGEIVLDSAEVAEVAWMPFHEVWRRRLVLCCLVCDELLRRAGMCCHSTCLLSTNAPIKSMQARSPHTLHACMQLCTSMQLEPESYTPCLREQLPLLLPKAPPPLQAPTHVH
jgi:hypothetical protein